ncbi:MAG: hypothetical protein Kow0090_16340 [Myxococcota bacterium]
MIYLDDNTTSMNPGDDKVIFFDEADKLRNARNRVALVGPSGDLWIGTELGLTIFDWNGTPELKCDDEIFHYNYKSELRTTIKAIGFHSSTNLWLVGDKLYYMKHSNTLKDDLDDMIYTFDTSTIFQSGSLPTNDHSSIAVSSKDGVWLGHIANGMSFLNAGLTPENQAGISAINYTTADGMVNNNVNALTLDDEKGVLFIATSGGASILQINDPLVKGDDLWLNYTTGNSPLPSNLVNAVYIQRSSAIDKKIIWFLTEGGAAALDPGANLLSRADDVWTVFTLSDGLASNSVSSMLSLVEQIAPGAERDRRFFGTSDGLSILDDNLTLTNKADDNWLFYPDKDFAPPSPLTSLNVSQMYSYLFMGAGDKLVVHDYYSDVFCKQNDAHCEIPIGIPGSVTGVGTPMNGDIVWIGTENGLFYWNYNATICNPGDDGWQTFTTTDGLSSNNIADVLTPMGNQYVFVATDQGLDLLDNKATFIGKADDTYTYYTHVSLTNLSQLLNIDTSNIAIASKTDGFAILTHSGTLTNIGDDTISVYTTVDLLPSDTINAIELIGMDVFVLATDSGLVVRDTKGTPHNKGDDVWQVYTAADGLPGNNILDVFVVDNQHAWLICDGSESIVWLDLGIMPTDKGDDNLTVINPMNSGLMRGTKRFIEPDFFSGQSLWYSLDAPGFGHMKFTLSGI